MYYITCQTIYCILNQPELEGILKVVPSTVEENSKILSEIQFCICLTTRSYKKHSSFFFFFKWNSFAAPVIGKSSKTIFINKQ